MKNIIFFFLLIIIAVTSCGNKDSEITDDISNSTPMPNISYKIGDILNYDDLKLVWSDEFNDGIMVNTKDWSYEVGYVRNQEIQYYTEARPENCRILNGNLVITGRREDFPYDYGNGTAEFTSASITTNKKHSWQYGRFEIRAKVPSGKGPWPAFWAKGINQNNGVSWPRCGEIDIMEYASKEPNYMVQNVIYGTGSGAGECFSKTKKTFSTKPYYEDFHIYSLDWNNRQITFAIDNVVTHVVVMNTIDPNPFNQPFFIIINLALGASTERTMGGKLDPSCLPVDFLVDYVRIYQRSK